MSDLPPGLLRNNRPVIDHFDDEEELYRRIMPGSVVKGRVTLDSIELPDMSVNRGSLGPPEWLLLDPDFQDWGIAKFQVRHIPSRLVHLGVLLFTFKPVHKPEKRNYPHTEVQAFENGEHIDGKQRLLDRDVHLRWRVRLARKVGIHQMPSV